MARKFCSACAIFACDAGGSLAQIVGHGCPEEVVEGMCEQAGAFFELPHATKMECVIFPSDSAWVAHGSIASGTNVHSDRVLPPAVVHCAL